MFRALVNRLRSSPLGRLAGLRPRAEPRAEPREDVRAGPEALLEAGARGG